MTYRVQIKRSAAKALRLIEREDRERLVRAIDRLADEPHAGGVLKGEFAGLRRIRVGVFRIVYEVHAGELTILVVRVAHRREAYP
jgi:mRNA interferase RelE/StbE